MALGRPRLHRGPLIRSPLGDECRRYFSSPQPRLPAPVAAPTAADPATKLATDKAEALARRQALAARSTGSTRHVMPTLGRTSSMLLGGGMGPA